MMGSSSHPDVEVLFRTSVRTDPSPQRAAETDFQFYDRVAGPFWDQIRELLTDWVLQVHSDTARHVIVSRLKEDEPQYRSALLELYVHTMLVRAGYDVQIEPELPGESKRLDFHAVRDDEELFLEVTSPGASKAVESKAARHSQLLSALEQVQAPNFFLWLGTVDVGRSSIPGRKLRAHVEHWISTLDPDEVSRRELVSSLADLPTCEWHHDDWSVVLRAIPVSKEQRGRAGHRPLGVMGDPVARLIDDAPDILRVLGKKSGVYGALPAPYVVVVGTHIMDRDHFHIGNALYGHEQIAFGDGSDARLTRDTDGFFIGPTGFRHKDVTGVLHVNQLNLPALHKTEVTLWPHPIAGRSLERFAASIPAETWWPRDCRAAPSAPPISSAQLFGLPDPWPQGRPWG